MIHPYRESVSSQLYPGCQQSGSSLIPAVRRFEEVLPLAENRRGKITWRTDQGFGGDGNVKWLLNRGYGLLVKGRSNRRAARLAAQVKRWQPVSHDKFAGRASTPKGFVSPLNAIAIRYATTKGDKHTYLFSTLKLSAVETARCYDQRGGAEIEFRSDKSGGLHIHKRRKHKRDAQEVWILLTDMAHNYLSWLSYTILRGSPLDTFGFLRTTRDLFRIPGRIEMDGDQLRSVKLLKSSPYADDLVQCLQRFWE